MITALNIVMSLIALWLIQRQHRNTVERLQKEIEHMEWVCRVRDEEVESLTRRVAELRDQLHKHANIGAW